MSYNDDIKDLQKNLFELDRNYLVQKGINLAKLNKQCNCKGACNIGKELMDKKSIENHTKLNNYFFKRSV